MSATEFAIRTGTSNITHQHCGKCGRLLFCSAAEPWYPQREWGECWCALGHWPADGEETPEEMMGETVATAPYDMAYHHCGPEYGRWVQDSVTGDLYWVVDGQIKEPPALPGETKP